MTQTKQSRSTAALNKTGKDLTETGSTKEDNKKLMLAVCDNLNELYEKLNKLSYLMGRKIMEHNLSQK